MALSPACRKYARALSHTSPRRAWWAKRSTCSATRSGEVASRVSTICACRTRRCSCRTPLCLQEAAVGHLVRQGMLESVFALGEQARLIEELGSLELRQAVVQGYLR